MIVAFIWTMLGITYAMSGHPWCAVGVVTILAATDYVSAEGGPRQLQRKLRLDPYLS